MKKNNKTDIVELSKDIQRLKIHVNMTLADLQKKFFELCRKHNIKRWTKLSDDSLEGDNFDWTLCYQGFVRKIQEFFEFDMHILTMENIPEDIKYRRAPNNNKNKTHKNSSKNHVRTQNNSIKRRTK